jgi:hypothetical protein
MLQPGIPRAAGEGTGLDGGAVDLVDRFHSSLLSSE